MQSLEIGIDSRREELDKVAFARFETDYKPFKIFSM
jgi:hypothetical protein